jgi:ribonuclease HIII
MQEAVKTALLQLASSATEKTEQNCRYRLDMAIPQGSLRVKQFTNGTLYLESASAEALGALLTVVNGILGIKTSASPKPLSNSTPKEPEQNRQPSIVDNAGLDAVPYIGTDESGKGDYFGPLVVAGVYVTPDTARQLANMGVMDSKRLNDRTMQPLAKEIERVVGPNGFCVIEMGPQRYNTLHAQLAQSGKNLNHLLAWGHAKALETLLEANPDCTAAIADQFGNERYICSELQQRGRGIRLHQMPRAEVHTGVAAASILARMRFVQKLSRLGDPYGMTLPPGAGSMVIQTAKALVRANGPNVLHQIAKYHFKTTQTVLETR